VSAVEQASRRRYRRFLVVSVVALGLVVGVGLGSLAVLADQPWLVALLLLPLGWRLVALTRRVPAAMDPVIWFVPGVALPVAVATYLLVSPELAPLGLGLAVAAWFVLLIGGGILEVVLDPDGRIAGGPD
jgi:hypothetical protein